MNPEFPLLETPRLVLREITESDAPALFVIHSDAEHMKWFGSDPLPDLAAALGLVKLFAGWRQQANPGTRWGIELKGTPGLVGTCGLFGWNRNWKKCTLGYELAPQATGRGLMREALEAVIPWGLGAMGLNRIEALVHERNSSSVSLLARLGFVQEGRLREGAFWNGKHHDMLQLSLLAAEWPGDHLMSNANPAVTPEVLQAFAEAWNRHDVDALMSFMSDDCVFEASAGPDACGSRHAGREAVRAAFAEVWAVFPDAHWGGARHFVLGDRGVSEWTFTGTRTDGTRVEVDGCDLFTFRDGKIALKDSYRKNRPPLGSPR